MATRDNELTKATQVQRDLSPLVEAGRHLLSSLDDETPLQATARLVVAHLADFCTIDLLDRYGQIRRAMSLHADPVKQSQIDQLHRSCQSPTLFCDTPIARVVATSQPLLLPVLVPAWYEQVSLEPAHRQLLEALQVTSGMIVPLAARKRTIGALSCFGATGHFTPTDLAAVSEFARYAAMAIDYEFLSEAAGSEMRVSEQMTEFVQADQQSRHRISELKAGAPLHERDEVLQALIAACPDLIGVVDLEGRIRLIGPSCYDILGYHPDQLEGSLIFDLLHPEDVSSMTEAFQAVASGGIKATQARHRFRHLDGHWVTLEGHGRLMTDAAGQPAGIVTINHDVSEHVRLEEALMHAKETAERASAAKSEFLSRMSHELRTPLNAILGFSQLLQMSTREPLTFSQSANVSQIVLAGRHLLDLINEILDIARIESGRLGLTLEAVELADALTEALGLVQPLAVQRNIQLVTMPRDKVHYRVHADRQRLVQVLLNLLSNAVKYNREGGRVDLDCVLIAGGKLRLTVRDIGPGIPEEKLDQLFQPFERLGAEATGIEGTGLGLALAKRLIEAMGGGIGVESAVDIGSTFWIELPLLSSQTSELPELGQRTRLPELVAVTTRQQATVLYIEDHLSNFELIKHILAERPHVRLISAMQGRLGIELARQHNPELILLDLQLPDVPGLTVFEMLRADPRTKHIPVVVISADATTCQVERLRRAGAEEFLAKPLDVRYFLAILDKLLKRGES